MQAPNMIHTIMVFTQSIIARLKISLNLLIISFRIKQFTNGFTKTFIRKMQAEILFKLPV